MEQMETHYLLYFDPYRTLCSKDANFANEKTETRRFAYYNLVNIAMPDLEHLPLLSLGAALITLSP